MRVRKVPLSAAAPLPATMRIAVRYYMILRYAARTMLLVLSHPNLLALGVQLAYLVRVNVLYFGVWRTLERTHSHCQYGISYHKK